MKWKMNWGRLLPGVIVPLCCGLLVAFTGCGDDSKSAPQNGVEDEKANRDKKNKRDDGDLEDWVARQRAMAAEGEGFLIWASNRTGVFRIWRCELDGTNERMISPEEEGKAHVAAHISPDGKRIAFASGPADGRYDFSPSYSLKVMDADGGNVRELNPRICLALGGCRSVVWSSPDELIYIDNRSRALKLNVDSGESEVLTEGGRYLLNRQLTYAMDRFSYHRYDPAEMEVIRSGVKFGGCGPYFSYDGRWGVRMNGAGGPLSRIDLATGEVVNLIEYDDPRLPSSRNYVYFPMVSRCGRLLTFSASRNRHDPVTSDYDIFVAKIDPMTLELVDDPVRYTFDPKTDRYPDIFLSEPQLGRHTIEAPATVDFVRSGTPADGSWNYGGGEEVNPGVARFDSPGVHEIEREIGGTTERGKVTVLERKAPNPVAVNLRGGKTLEVVFDEEVDASSAVASLGSGIPLRRAGGPGCGRIVVFELEEDLTLTEDTLSLSGVVDLAQVPNAMQPAELQVKRPPWPANVAESSFVWQGAAGEKQADGAVCSVTAHGRGQLDRNGAMALRGGSFSADAESSSRTFELISTSLEITLEAMILPAVQETAQLQAIISLTSDSGIENIVLGQDGDLLTLRIQDAPEKWREFDLCQISAGSAHHVAITYGENNAVCYLDGNKVFETAGVAANFRHWPESRLRFGSGTIEGDGWAGKLDGVAVYGRVMGAAEIAANQSSAKNRWEELASGEVQAVEIEAELVAMSKMPTLNEISPYREGLVVGEFKVNGILGGAAEGVDVGENVRVAMWAIQDNELLPISTAEAGDRFTMRLEPFDAQSQLKSHYRSETLPPVFTPLMFDTGEAGSAAPVE